jgi:ABC-type transport system involved in multi-copper enzyme maturation permease subunit
MLMAVLAQGLGAMCRSTVGGVFSLVGLLMILSSIVSITSSLNSQLGWLESISMCLPGASIGTFMRGPASGPTPTFSNPPFTPVWWQSGLIFLAWTAVFYIIGVIVVRRSDVKG